MYMLSSIIGLGFIGTFVLVVVLLMLDFWTVIPPSPERTPHPPGATPACLHSGMMCSSSCASACAICKGVLRDSAVTFIC